VSDLLPVVSSGRQTRNSLSSFDIPIFVPKTRVFTLPNSWKREHLGRSQSIDEDGGENEKPDDSENKSEDEKQENGKSVDENGSVETESAPSENNDQDGTLDDTAGAETEVIYFTRLTF